jgi:hypothetical protein
METVKKKRRTYPPKEGYETTLQARPDTVARLKKVAALKGIKLRQAADLAMQQFIEKNEVHDKQIDVRTAANILMNKVLSFPPTLPGDR